MHAFAEAGGENHPDACLIAAAPELLRACLLVSENAPLVAEWLRENDPGAYAQVRKAINDAIGEPQ